MASDAERSNPGMVGEERIARMIARALGHNDDGGMEWRKYLCASQLILRECRVMFPKIA